MHALLIFLTACGVWLDDQDLCSDRVDRVRWYADQDGDGYGDPGSAARCERAEGLVDNAEDCDDQDPRVGTVEDVGEVVGVSLWCRDDDADGVGRSDDCLLTCDPPEGYEAPERGDCDDDNPWVTSVCPWVQVDAQFDDTCGLRSDGSIACWGAWSKPDYTDGPGPGSWVELSVGSRGGCARSDDGHTECWGTIPSPPEDLRVSNLAAGDGAACGLTEAGAVECWASDGAKYLEIATERPLDEVGFVDVEVERGGACAVHGNGSVVCWGHDDWAPIELGVPTSGQFTQVTLTTLPGFGSYVACALTTEGQITCWGQASDIGNFDSLLDRPPSGSGYLAVELGGAKGWALREDGQLEHWGEVEFQELEGYEPLDDARQLSVGGRHACALRETGQLACWGEERLGVTDIAQPGAVELVAGGAATCAITTVGSDLRCWGEPLAQTDPGFEELDAAGSTVCFLHDGGRVECLGRGSGHEYVEMPREAGHQAVFATSPMACSIDQVGRIACFFPGNPERLPGTPVGSGWLQGDASDYGACALHTDGHLACWSPWNMYDPEGGWNQPGDKDFVEVSVGSRSACALDRVGAITCWGDGYEESPDTPYPSRPPEGEGFVSVGAGLYMGCAVGGDGGLSCWDATGALPVPTEADFTRVDVGKVEACGLRGQGEVVCWRWDQDTSYLEMVPGEDGWIDIQVSEEDWNACVRGPQGEARCWGLIDKVPQAEDNLAGLSMGERHGCALWHDQVRCFGDDRYGQASPPLDPFVAVAAGSRHSCALDPQGGVSCWGADELGQSTPPDFHDLAVTALALGDRHSCALLEDGSLSCWGSGVAIAPPQGRDWVSLASGPEHACAVDASGAVRCWGDDAYGRATVPEGLPPVTQVVTGLFHTCVLGEDGYPTCWGMNSFGQAASPKVRLTAITAGGEHTCGIRLSGLPWCWGRDEKGQATPPDWGELIGE